MIEKPRTLYAATEKSKNWLKAHRRSLLITAGVLALAFGVMWQRCGIRGCPDVDKLKGYMPDQASTIVDYKGREVGKLYVTPRQVVLLDSLPEYVPNAFIALEDKRFWQHKGVDWRRVMGAAWSNVKAFGVEEGSSTITMQLARNAFPDKLPAHKRTLLRKIAEARVARAIERKYTKEEILQLYLNQIYFGNGAYGIEAAAREYFAKPAAKLLLSEAALLAALPRAPSRMNPRQDRELALEGRSLVLGRMVEQELISRNEAEGARKARLRVRHGTTRDNQPAPYFVETIRGILEDELGDDIYSEGYTIHTTLDMAVQQALEQELARQLNAIESGAFGTFRHATLQMVRADTSYDETGTAYLQTAAIFMDARSGDVRALVGGRNFEDSEYNRALYAKRQPGSAFKPFVYAAAFAAGYAPTHRLMDRPLRLVLSRRQVWEPKNFDGSYKGVVTMRDALTHSRNVPTIRLATEIGIGRVVDLARQMGLSGRIPQVPSVVLGTAELTPIDMTGAFAAFATLGARPMPRFITRVEDRNGNIVFTQGTDTRQVIDPAVAFMTVSLMQDVVDRGTGYGVRAAGYRDPAAGKTGTTNDAADIWYIGITPEMVGTIWIGFDKRKTVLARGTGGELAAPVWGRVMRRAGKRSGGWTPPAGVEMRMVDEFGNVIGASCPVVGVTRREYFIQGTAPIESCYSVYDPLAWDSLRYTADSAYVESDASWFARMRSRIFRNDPKEEEIELPAEPDTLSDTMAVQQRYPPVVPEMPKPKPVPYDSLVKAKKDSLQKMPADTQIQPR